MSRLKVGALIAAGFALGLIAQRAEVVERASGALHAAVRAVATLTDPPEEPPLRAGPSRRAQTPPGLSLWVVDDSTKVFPGDPLGTPWAAGNPVQLTAAGGETVAFQLVLASREGASGVDILLEELAGPAGTIPRERIEALLEWYVACPEVEPKVVSLGPGEYPDALLPLRTDSPESEPVAAPFDVQAGRNQPIWVDVSVPRGTPAGRYQGAIRIRHDGRDDALLPLHLSVHPFELPRQRSLVAWAPLYATRLWKREGFDRMEDPEIAEILWKYYRMARAHGFDTQIKRDEPDVEFDQLTGALEYVDWSRYDLRNARALSGELFEDGIPPKLWMVGGGHWWGLRPGDPPNFGDYYKEVSELNPAHRRALAEYAKEIASHFAERGWTAPRLFIYPVDEPDLGEHPNYASIIRSYGEVLKASGTGIGQLITISPNDAEEPVGFVDIWAAWAGGYHPKIMAERQRHGEWTWFYQHHEPFVGGNSVNTEGLSMRSWPWIAWRYQVDGVFLWAANFWNEDPYRDPGNWSDNLLSNGIFFYPGALTTTIGLPPVRGPVSSFRMKALRRGLQDYEYFQMLRSLGGDPDPLVASVVRSALNEEDPAKRHWEHPRWERHGDWSHDPADWDAVRAEVARRIVERLGS